MRFSEHRNPLVTARNRWHELRFSNRSIPQAKANARAHYGLGKAFYQPWLDRVGMMYTCAYWKEGTRTLEEAQQNKMDHVCRKVQLKQGETFVDVGCGFGGLLFHAYRNFGALGTGINATTEQVAELREDLVREGLAGRIRVIECDFREIPGQYDKLLSIGTLEHAGRDQLTEVVRAHANAMKPGALGVIHFIGHVSGVCRTRRRQRLERGQEVPLHREAGRPATFAPEQAPERPGTAACRERAPRGPRMALMRNP